MKPPPLIGVLKLKTRFPRFIGDIGNPESFNCPVKYATIDSATVSKVTVAEPLPEALIADIEKHAKTLIAEKVTIITTSCGFLNPLQQRLAALSTTPVICSSLSLLPLLANIYGGADHIGILTYNTDTLNPKHLAGETRCSIEGLIPQDTLRKVIARDLPDLDFIQAQKEVLGATIRLQSNAANLRAIILECTNLSPYKQEIRKHTGLPVFDIIDAIHYLLDAEKANSKA